MSAASNRRAKDAAMASAMKAQGIERRSGTCPMCHRAIPLDALYGHIATVKCAVQSRHRKAAA